MSFLIRMLLFSLLHGLATSLAFPQNISASYNITASPEDVQRGWDHAVQQGILRWQQLQGPSVPDIINPPTVKSLQTSGWEFRDEESRWPPQSGMDRSIPDYIKRHFGWTEYRDFYTVIAEPKSA